MILILALLLAQESADEVIKALSQESAVARGEAADKLVARGRKSIPVLRQAIERAATVRDEAQKAVDRIGSAEVAALLKERGHAELNDLRRATHAALTAALPHATVDLLPANAACGACKNVERVAVLNDLTDEKGGPRIIAKPEELTALFPASKDETAVRATAAAVLYVLRAMHPKAHTTELVPAAKEAYLDPKKLEVEAKDGSKIKAGLQINHQICSVHIAFDKEGRLVKIEVIADGPS